MPRLIVHVEGQTEETFVNEVLSSYLAPVFYDSVSARIVGNARLRSRRGGIKSWEAVRGDILRHLWGDPGAVATLLVDYYALPLQWPGRIESQGKQGSSRKAEFVEAALHQDLVSTAGSRFDPRRFVPFVTMHEFEGLLFSDPVSFAREIGQPKLADSFMEIRQAFDTPEDINDSEETAPSKRVLSLYSGYEKPLLGTLAAIGIGLGAIRKECPHFNDWLNRIETLSAALR